MDFDQSTAPARHESTAQVSSTASDRSEAEALEAALRDMAASFSSDFTRGLIGQRHNTFEHRSRILRQMTTELASMRARDTALAL